MHAILLSLAFCAAVQSIPLPSPDDTSTNNLIPRDDDDIIFEDATFTYFSSYYEEDEEEDKGSKYLNDDDDPAFAPIFAHLEEILESDRVTPATRLQHIQDAIVHSKESWRDAPDAPRTSMELVDEIYEILGLEEVENRVKIERIWLEIAKDTGLGGKVEGGSSSSTSSTSCDGHDDDDTEQAVLGRISWHMAGPESAQKRIKMMLNELAGHLHPQSSSSSSPVEEEDYPSEHSVDHSAGYIHDDHNDEEEEEDLLRAMRESSFGSDVEDEGEDIVIGSDFVEDLQVSDDDNKEEEGDDLRELRGAVEEAAVGDVWL